MRVRRSLWNFLSTLVLTLVTMIVGLKASPLLAFWLGEGPFGAVRIMTEATGLLTLLELGLSGALGPLMSRAIGQNNEADLHKAVVAGSRGYLRVSILIIGVGLVLTPIISWFTPGLTAGQVNDLRLAWVVGLGAFLPMAFLPLRTVVEAEQRGYIINFLLTAQSLLMTGMALTLARSKWGITGQSIAVVTAGWFFNFVLATMVFRSHPGLLKQYLWAPTDRETRNAMRGLSWPVLLINIFGRLGMLTDNLVIGRAIGEKKVTSLFFTQRLVVLGQQVLQGIGNATWAALADLHARGELILFNRRLVELSRLVAVLAAVGLGPVIAYNHAFFRLWANSGEVYEGDFVVVVASVNVFLVSLQSLWCWCFTATGQVRRIVPLTVIGAVINLSASMILVNYVGVAGPLLGTAVGLGSVGLWVLPMELKGAFGTSPLALVKATLPAFLWAAVSASGLWSFTRFHQPTTWLTLGLEMSVAALLSLAFSVAFLLSAEERTMWRTRLVPARFRQGASA